MDAERPSGPTLIATVTFEHHLDEHSLEFLDGFRVQNSTILHASDERFPL